MSDTNTRPQGPAARPLSPHLQIYTPMLTMMMSIAHRITGIGLYVGTILLAYWLIALSGDAKTFAGASWFLGSFIGQLILFGFTWALFHHMLGGVRHALWDSGWGMDDPEREWLAQGTLVGGIVLTVLVWIISFIVR
jgi:succinate dehydrogenase / fumarate reductase cytochrome b subunit